MEQQQHDTPAFNPGTRHDGWSPELKARFLAFLSEQGNVRAAAARVGRSAQSAYVQRRRDALFDRSWAAALVLAREASEQVFADRALDGVEEPVFYRGEQVGTRRRYDNRLLLAHMARLDQLADDEEAMADAGRFDELLALVAGERFAEETDEELPPEREAYCQAAAQGARRATHDTLPYVAGKAGQVEKKRAIDAAGGAAHAEAAIRWDLWFARACAVADRLQGAQQVSPWTPSTSSTSLPARGAQHLSASG